MPKTLNPAVKANLERVIDEVRLAAARRLAWVRLATSLVVTAIFFFPPVDPRTQPTRMGCIFFLVGSSAVLLAIHRVPSFRRWAALSLPLLDVPMATLLMVIEGPRLPAPWHLLPPNLAVMAGIVSLSTLSLSRAVIGLTAAMATPSVFWCVHQAGLPWQPVVLASAMPSTIAAVGFGVVSRIRALVHAARKRDLLGKYVLGDRLGVGGMAEVFSATYSPEGGFERRVAIKRMLPSIASSPESVALFRREAELGAMLAHRNIVQVLDFGADEGSYFMAMEFVDGVPLSRILADASMGQGAPLPIPAIAAVALGMAEALDYLHTRTAADGTALDLIHRDVNPPNILISHLGEVKLGDLGIARGNQNTLMTEAGTMRGKLSYSPPEQIRGERLDARADLFGLGVTLHEALTNRRLFSALDAGELARSAMHDPIALPSSQRPEVPAELEQVVMRLVERDREKRTPSARVLLDELRALPPALRSADLGQTQLAERVMASRAMAKTPPTAGRAALAPTELRQPAPV